MYQRINGSDWRNIWLMGDLHGCFALLMERLAPQLTPEDRRQAEALLLREQQARSGEQLSAQNSTQSMQEML